MSEALNLDAYLSRIGWTGPTSPTYDTLSGLIRAHELAIPFENLDPLLGRSVSLELEALQEKMVGAKRGGYCFEHATLFGAVLERLGFDLLRHSARVTIFVPRAQANRTHMFLTVRLPEGRFVVDPGFGPFAAPFPIPLADRSGDEPGDDGASHWLVRDGDYWVLRMRREGEAVNAWVTTLEPDNPVDFELANYWTSTAPKSPFRNIVMMSKLRPEGRATVMNQDLTIRIGGDKETVMLKTRHALREIVVKYFGFDIPEIETMTVPAVPDWTEA